jgi:type I restriction-modification system DNA methylase subunit
VSLKTTAQARIAQLVEDFRALPEEARLTYNEQEMRLRFILPMFEALGWNIKSASDMSAEEQISRGYVDFGFYLNGIPVFYVETKRVSENMNRPEWGKQAINYAWLRGVTWAVLTDFERLKVFNAEVMETVPARAVFLDLHFEDYAGHHFEDLWLLSKEAFQTGAIHQLAERYGKKAKKEPVSRVLFAQMTQWRRDLFKEMKTWGNLWKENLPALDEAVQRFLDRLVFIRTLEDRQVEQPRLQALLRQYKDKRKKNKSLFGDLLALFHELDGVYNANLFAQHPLDFLELHNDVLLENIINGLYDAPGGYHRYDFNAISVDILGSIYEQYLSFKVIDPKGETALVTNGNGNGHSENGNGKSGKRKDQGIFYTPQFAVRYIVQQTLGRLLQEGADPYQIRVLDPACGSGSFLIEAFDLLDRWLAEHGTAEDRADQRQRRLRILRENLYGVDLDPQAIEVAQLNLFLRAANERGKLPMLYYVREGNSLVEDSSIAGEKAFDWRKKFPKVMEAGGFDIVVGNPPYGATVSAQESDHLHQLFKRTSGTYDSYEMFMLKAASLLKDGGKLGMIIPSSWMTGENYATSRQTLLKQLSPTSAYALPFDVFAEAYVDTAIMTFTKNPQNPEDCLVHYFPKRAKLETIPDNVGYRVSIANIQADPQHRFSIMLASELMPITAKMTASTAKFGDWFRITRGVQPYSRAKHSEADIAARFLHADHPKTVDHLPELQGSELSRYFIAPQRSAYLEYSERLASIRPKEVFEGPRIVLRRLLTRQFRLQASLTELTMISTDNIITLLPRKPIALWWPLALLNSRLISWHYVGMSMVAQKDDFPQVHLSALEALSIPLLDDTQALTIQTLVTDMLHLHQQVALAEAQKSSARHSLTNDINQLDKRIDDFVYHLYGLTEDQIALVEALA